MPEPTTPERNNHCDHPSTTTGSLPIITPGADALGTATIEEETGRRIRFTRTRETVQGSKIPTGLKVLIAASFMIALGYGLVAPVLPSFARSFNVGVTATTIVVSALAAMRLAFAPSAGKLISRFGERPIYTCGMIIVAVSSFVNAAAWDYWVLLASRAFAGIGSVMFTVSAMGLLVRLAPSHMRGRVSGYYATAFLLGNIMGPVVGGALSGLGMRLPFALYGCSLLVAGAIVWFMLPPADQIDAEREAYSLPPPG
ncbi:MFS transporter [Rothia aeria]|uniref:MFS transporter n=1 Tax=Rothia aeria TaxID=172042 RepID=UPI003B00B551